MSPSLVKVGFDQLSNEINDIVACEVDTGFKFLTVENFPVFHKFMFSWRKTISLIQDEN